MRSIIRDDRPMSPAHYMAEYVHIWYILCAPVRDFACAFVCTLATAKQHTKERRTITAEKQNFLCVLCRGESHARALQLPLLLFRFLFLSSSVCWFAAPLLLCCCCLISSSSSSSSSFSSSSSSPSSSKDEDCRLHLRLDRRRPSLI